MRNMRPDTVFQCAVTPGWEAPEAGAMMTAMACQGPAALSARGTRPASAAGSTCRWRRLCEMHNDQATLGGMKTSSSL